MARSELVIGLVGPLGIDLHRAGQLVADQLGRVGYEATPTISLSGRLDCVTRDAPLPQEDGPYDEYIAQRQEAGNDLRRDLGRGDALALLAAAEITRYREQAKQRQGIVDSNQAPEEIGYVLRSIKHPEEAETLRSVYAERFVLVGFLLPRERRIARLAERIANTRGGLQGDQHRAKALELAGIDEQEEGHDLGQQMRDAFALADVFIDMSNPAEAARDLERFFNALLADPFASPTPEEYAMFHAHAAGLRSADLSRQVGAAIVGDRADVLAVGCNEAPRYGGGAYWVEDQPDGRDLAQGGDPNAKLRRVIMDQVRGALIEAGVFNEESAPTEAKFRAALQRTRLDDLTEFGRVVHAEMHALLEAARRGVSIKGARIFTTTFPCHNCAKHLVAAGLTEVRYIAPYPKSLAGDLHPESIVIEPDGAFPGRLRFVPFYGVAPSMYGPLFAKGKVKRRRDDGSPVEFDPRQNDPKLVTEGDLSYLEREDYAVRSLRQTAQDKAVGLDLGCEEPAPAATGEAGEDLPPTAATGPAGHDPG